LFSSALFSIALPAAAMSAPAPAVVLQAPSSAADPTRTSKVKDVMANRIVRSFKHEGIALSL
jgi:hypothetical protein